MLPIIQNIKRTRKSNHLAKMNIPPLLARQDASYDYAIKLFVDNLFSHAEEKRSNIYQHILKLLDEAIQSRMSIPISFIDHKDKISDPINQYFLLLKDTIKAACALVTHEMILFQEEKQLSNFIGSEITSQFRSTDEIFANSELNIYHSTNELIEMAEPVIHRHRERLLKSFSSEDLIRYNKSFSEFSILYINNYKK